MNKKFIFLFILYFTVGKTYSQHTVLLFDNGKKQAEGNIVNGKKDGPWYEWYYENGRLKGDKNVKKDIYFLQGYGAYKEGRRDGFWMERSLEDSFSSIVNGMIFNPDYRSYYPLWLEGSYEYGKKHGLWKAWIMDAKPYDYKKKNWKKQGELVLEMTFNSGELVGQFTRYYKEANMNMKARVVCNLNFGQRDGKYSVYYDCNKTMYVENGQVNNGELNGLITVYSEDYSAKDSVIITKKQMNYRDGKLDGQWLLLDENDNILDEKFYKDGILSPKIK